MNALVKKKLRKSTIVYILMVAAGSLASQIAMINAVLANHPKMSWLGAGAIMIVTLLHSPEAKELLEAVKDSADA